MSRRELEYWQSYNASASTEAYEECIDESVLPVVAAGQALLVAEDHAIDDQVWLEPLIGHTPGHFGVRLKSNGAEAIMIGDLMHSPVQCARPDWHSSSDFDPEQGRRVRRQFLENHAETDKLVLTAHFPSPSVGHIRREGAEFRFRYAD
jgi:glyoxylase-like metal-dependent hydrolase (beta-lactamase superfamily II)